MQKLIFSLFTFLFLLPVGLIGVQAQSLSDLSFGTDSTLEVMTWNLQDFPKSGGTTIDSVKKAMEALEVDVIAFQEIENKSFFEQMVNGVPGWQAYTPPNIYNSLAYAYRSSAINVVAIYEILDASPNWRPLPRAPLVMEMQFQGQDFVLINNHLKCCGDGNINANDPWDEEQRRVDANVLLKDYIDLNLPTANVILLGDLNDEIQDLSTQNVFLNFLYDPGNFFFADSIVAYGSPNNWSYPSWPSHLDHLLITYELFDEFDHPDSRIQTLKIGNFLPGGSIQYFNEISDHRPVALRLGSEAFVVSRETAALPPTRLEVYPNPSTGLFHFEVNPGPEPAALELYDLQGQLLQTLLIPPGTSRVSWGLTHLPTGMYYAKFRQNGVVKAVKKLVKSR